jgi:hypothetical protein
VGAADESVAAAGVDVASVSKNFASPGAFAPEAGGVAAVLDGASGGAVFKQPVTVTFPSELAALV